MITGLPKALSIAFTFSFPFSRASSFLPHRISIYEKDSGRLLQSSLVLSSCTRMFPFALLYQDLQRKSTV